MNSSIYKPIEIEFAANRENLYVFYGGISAGIGMNVLEFYKVSRIIDENKIFVRDFSQCWYHEGLPGISNDIDSTVAHIDHLIKQINPKRTFFVGNSMGGYAAILFGSLLGNIDVIAFAPQTFICPILRLKHGDSRWQEQVNETYSKSILKRREFDLRPLLLCSNQSLKVSIFVSTEDRLDYIHAARVKDIAGVRVYEYESGGHGVVKMLRDNDKLAAIMLGRYEQNP